MYPVNNDMIRAAREEMRPFTPPNDETLRRAIGAAMTAYQSSSDIVCPLCGEGDFDAVGLTQHFLRYWCKGMQLEE